MQDFEGKTALISGGAEGIGLSIAQALGKQGMQIVLGDIDAAQLAIAHKALEKQGVAVISIVMDVTLPEDWQRSKPSRASARFTCWSITLASATVRVP